MQRDRKGHDLIMLRDVLIVMRGTVVAGLIGLLVLPLLTRLFTPEAFGHLQLYQSFLLLLIVIPTLRYDIAILRAENEEELSALAWICLCANVGMTLLVSVAYEYLRGLNIAGLSTLAPVAVHLATLAMFVTGMAQVYLNVALRQSDFSVNANTKVVQALTYSVASVGLGAGKVGVFGIIMGDFIGRVAVLGVLVWRYRTGVFRRIPWSAIRTAAWRFREYPFFALPGGVVNSLGGMLTPVLIYATFSASASGQFGLVERSLLLPVGLIINSVSQIYTAQVSQLVREGGDCRSHFYGILRLLSLAAIVPVVLIMLLAPMAFSLIFGEEWRLAGSIAQSMAPAFFFQLLAGSVHMTLAVVGYQKVMMSWEIGRLVLMTCLWLAISHFGIGFDDLIMLYAAATSLASIFFLLLCIIVLQRPYHKAPLDRLQL